ncbi:hypothetical protein SPHV1_50059 [Novosphingobium sp. KN65.2]|nr:hypothetical protein SPHV1_50059 [Novosphingobium sp. KN65.2]
MFRLTESRSYTEITFVTIMNEMQAQRRMQ